MGQPHHFILAEKKNGFTLIEVLITLVVVAFGLLALAGFLTKATTLTADAGQRARAGVLANDMAVRIANQKTIAANYASTSNVWGAALINCSGKAGADLDLCQWNNLLVGANDAGSTAATALGYRGCIALSAANEYTITLAWGSLTPGVPPPTEVTCGATAFGDESYRRFIRMQVRVADLDA